MADHSDPLRPRPSGRRSLSNAVWLYLDQVVRLLWGLLTFGLVARYLGTEGFGALSYAVAFPALFLPFISLGLDFVVIQELVRRPGDEERILGTACLMMAGAAVIATVCAAMLWMAMSVEGRATPLVWMTLPSLLAQPWQVIDQAFQSRQASKYVVVVRFFCSLLGNATRIALVFGQADLVWFAGLVSVEAFLLVAGLVFARNYSGSAQIRPLRDFDYGEAGVLMREAWPLMLGGVAMALYLRLDQLLLERLAGLETLGVYAAAVRLGDMTQYVTYAVIVSYFPRLVSIHGGERVDFLNAVRRFLRVVTWLAVAVAMIVSILAPWITSIVLGGQFSAAAPALICLAWANVFAAQIGVRGKWLLLERKQVLGQSFFLVGAVVHLVNVWWWAAERGALAVSVSFLIAQASMALLAPLVFPQSRHVAWATWNSFNPRHAFHEILYFLSRQRRLSR